MTALPDRTPPDRTLPETGPPARLEAAYRAWTKQPWTAHAAAILVLAAILVVRWWPAMTNPEPLPDERIYFVAFEAVLAGKSPASARGYLYFPFLAIVGAKEMAALGPAVVAAQMRLANLLGLAVTAWCALAWSPWGARRKVIVAAAVLSVAPAASFGMTYGNLSLAVSGMVVGGLLLWPRAPVTAGGLLGLSIAVKPLAPVAVLALWAHLPPSRGRRHVVAAVVAGAVAGVLVLGFPYLGDLLSRAQPELASRTVSLHRFPYLFGLRLHPAWVTGIVGIATLAFVAGRPLPRRLFLCVAVTATLAATPLVWNHTLLMTLPIQALAIETAWWRSADRRAAGGPKSLLQRLEVLLVLLAVAAIHFSAGATGIDDQALWLQLAGTIPPALAPGILTAYLFTGPGRPVLACGNFPRGRSFREGHGPTPELSQKSGDSP
jgi:hypothetical protein